MVVIGGGVIGLELGSVWRRLGAKVTVVEFLDQILPGMDGEVRKECARIFKKQGFDIRTSTKVTGAERKGKKRHAHRRARRGRRGRDDRGGHRPGLDRPPARTPTGLDLDKAGLATNKRGQIEVDHEFKTDGRRHLRDRRRHARARCSPTRPRTRGSRSPRILAGQIGIVNHEVIPCVVYTMPEIAGVGLTEEEAKAAGQRSRSASSRCSAIRAPRPTARATASSRSIADAKSDRVLGVWIIASVAGTMIAEAALAMEFGATSEDIAYTCHAHPTHSEAVKEAAMAVTGKPIHV